MFFKFKVVNNEENFRLCIIIKFYLYSNLKQKIVYTLSIDYPFFEPNEYNVLCFNFVSILTYIYSHFQNRTVLTKAWIFDAILLSTLLINTSSQILNSSTISKREAH